MVCKTPTGRVVRSTLSLWTDLGSSFETGSLNYLRAVEARRVFDINTAWQQFAWQEAVRAFRESEELVVDLIMDQSRLPGVGNIIKSLGATLLHTFLKAKVRRALCCSDLSTPQVL